MNKSTRNLALVVVLAGIIAAIAYVNRSKGDIAKVPLANFAVEDTAAVDRIFIVDANQQSVTLERDPNSRYWDLNKDFKARKDAIDLLLKTFKRIRVKSPVPATARENVIRLLAGAGKKVEIYQGGEKPVKTYIVGNATQDHTGTYMLLETAEDGRSTEPFITYMEGFTGFLSTRFFTEFDEWRYTGIFDYPKLDFKKVELRHHRLPQASFSIAYEGGNDIQLFDFQGREVPQFDTLAVKDYLLMFKKAHIETYKSYLTPVQEDSLLKTQPAYTLSVTEQDGSENALQLYFKKPVKDIFDENGNLEPYDMARMYAGYKGEVGLAQLFVFEPMIRTSLQRLQGAN